MGKQAEDQTFDSVKEMSIYHFIPTTECLLLYTHLKF